MSIIRVQKTKDYTVMSNAHLRDKRLSLKSKGLMSQMLSLPEDWDYSVAGLAAINIESVGTIKTALNELKTAGYLVVTKLYPDKTESGRFEYIYDLYETPQNQEEQEMKKQEVEKQEVEKQPLENHPLNKYIDKQNIDKQNKDIQKKETVQSVLDSVNITDIDLYNAIGDFIDMRKKLRKPLTPRAMKMLLNKLWKLSGGDYQIMRKIIERSILKGWQDVYPYEDDTLPRRQMTVRVQTEETLVDNPFTALKREEGL